MYSNTSSYSSSLSVDKFSFEANSFNTSSTVISSHLLALLFLFFFLYPLSVIAVNSNDSAAIPSVLNILKIDYRLCLG